MPIADATPLRGLCGGAVHLPGDAGYEFARVPWNLTADLRPAAVAYPATVDEVAEVVRAAGAAGLRVAAQGPGHNAGALGPLDDVVILRTAGMLGIEVDADERRARVSAGVLWMDAMAAITPYGLTARHPSGPDVGVTGYSLGGGVGWFVRRHGLQSSAVTGLDVVLADGSLVQVDADREPELFWGLRGGGGNFGVVTALEFELLPVRSAYAGTMAWDVAQAPEVLARWAQWAPEAPDAVSASLRLLRIPADQPGVPPSLRGRRLVVVDAAVLAEAAEGARLTAALRELRPVLDTFTTAPAAELQHLHQEPLGPQYTASGSAVLAGLPDAGADALLDAAGPDSTGSILWVELRQLGGALARSTDADGSATVDGAYLLLCLTLAETAEARLAAKEEVGQILAAMTPYGNDRLVLNFASSAVDARRGYRPADWERLRRLRAQVDPGGRFVANHPIPPAG